MRDVALTLMSVLLLLTGTAMADIIYVDCNGGGDYLTIQEGIDAAVEGWTVLVEPGTYTGPLNRNLDFGGTNIELRSTAGLSSTIIDCEGQDRGFYFHNGETSASVIDGFTVANAYDLQGAGIWCEYSSPTLINMKFLHNTAYDHGGGMWCGIGCESSLTNVTFYECAAWTGAGMYCFMSSPTLTNVAFKGNVAEWSGGGMRVLCGAPTLTNVSFLGNQALGHDPPFGLVGGGAIHLTPAQCEFPLTINQGEFENNSAAFDGGGLLVESGATPPHLTSVQFSDNHAGRYGGAVVLSNSGPSMSDVQFYNNTAVLGGALVCQAERVVDINGAYFSGNSADYGGAIYGDWQASPSLQNVALASNSAVFEGGGIYCHDGGFPSLNSVTFYRNTAEFGGGIACHGPLTAARNRASGTLTIERSTGSPGETLVSAPRSSAEPDSAGAELDVARAPMSRDELDGITSAARVLADDAATGDGGAQLERSRINYSGTYDS
ncbi:MAG: hypothetical protein IMY84_04205, partial [Chloroflexi bacterium]|nr:hypothetical protein [Chloroflexota bacterium]